MGNALAGLRLELALEVAFVQAAAAGKAGNGEVFAVFVFDDGARLFDALARCGRGVVPFQRHRQPFEGGGFKAQAGSRGGGEGKAAHLPGVLAQGGRDVDVVDDVVIAK